MERQGRPEGQPLERARALAPLFDRCAEAVEAERRLVPDLLDGLREAGLFRLLLPRVLDGGEVDPVTFVEVVEEIAKADGSAAWCLCQAGGCAMTAAYLSPEVARHVFEDPRAVLAWGPGPDARAVAVARAATASPALGPSPADAGTPPGWAGTAPSSRPRATPAGGRMGGVRSAPCCSRQPAPS
jgi:alkylation response protein AidB-like acyl-CoA dehydrogenase